MLVPLLPVTVAMVFRSQLELCTLPRAPPDPTSYPARTAEVWRGKGTRGAQPYQWLPNHMPDRTTFTEYDWYGTKAGMYDPFFDVEAVTLKQCKVDGILASPYLKVAARGCEFADGALALNERTIELQLSDCKGAPLKAAAFKFKPWTGHTEGKKKLEEDMQKMTSRPSERGLSDIIGSYAYGNEDPLEKPHRGRYVKIDNCPLANDPELFRVLWRSLCDFTHFDPRPDFNGVKFYKRYDRAGRKIRKTFKGFCHGPFGGRGKAELLLSDMELSTTQFEAAIGAMLPGQVLVLSRVTLTGTPSVQLPDLLSRTLAKAETYLRSRSGLAKDPYGPSGHDYIYLRSSGSRPVLGVAEFERLWACARGAGPQCPLKEATEEKLQEGGHSYVPWFSPSESEDGFLPEYTFGVRLEAA